MKIHDIFNSLETYIIAEVAQNHDGSLGQAHAYIEAIAKAGADAVKFQTHIADEESTIYEPFRVPFSYCDKTRYDYWKRMEFTAVQWQELYDHAVSLNLDFLSSPFSVNALLMLDDIGVSAWKIGSGEVFNSILLNKAIATGKPILLSTGLSTYLDIESQIDLIRKSGNDFLLFQCITEYPSMPEETPIKLIQTLSEKYKCPVGISDHSATIYPSLAAVALGARAVEVHVTMSKEMFGPDVKASVDLKELNEIVVGAKCISKMLRINKNMDYLTDKQGELKQIFSKSIYAARDIPQNCIISEDDFSIKKPAIGIAAADYKKIIGLRTNRTILRNEPITWEEITK